ncbi:hypothetical protein ITJ55_15175 [Frigoribacterium sp. VKM Ac-1396]|uniref:hypothetical protein n=1 Tax=Frigoribacterium sp. VKM Ac-1396 TaxID=2783821 RepID=UPI00188A8820|nr:hypothetical protein [Frigoribacterium sp. VKM Ac-1396]MBF4602149.1 hypothetical protein [Frigoribacterium sp. VKM Ac-1396]
MFVRRPPSDEKPATGWQLVVIGLVFIALGVGAFLAFSYWDWQGRIEGLALFGVPIGIVVIIWGITRLVRDAVRIRRARRAS